MIIKKSLGQNFLIDKNIAKKIINIHNDINKYTIIVRIDKLNNGIISILSLKSEIMQILLTINI